jgi:hypothetical protein
MQLLKQVQRHIITAALKCAVIAQLEFLRYAKFRE